MLPDALQAHARTVMHLAVYFEELKQAALRLRDQCAVRERGFFSPSEDEAARQLLISYWMARTALFEVVIGYRDADSVPPPLQPARFLIGYAAALLLVDAARFLRENYHDQPVIRATTFIPATRTTPPAADTLRPCRASAPIPGPSCSSG